MTREEFKKFTEHTVLLDGATGSGLMAAGMPKGVCTEQWVMEHKDVIVDLQKKYVDAGSQIIYAPTFGANPISLSKFHLEDQIEIINCTLVSYSKEAAAGKAYVAGDLTTTGEMMDPFGDLTYDEAYKAYKTQIQHLVNAGVDILVVETMFNVQETLAALEAAQAVCDLPVMCSMTVDADGSFFMGGNIFNAAGILADAGADAVGVNCSVGPDQLESVIQNLVKTVSIPVIAKPNAGMPTISSDGQAVYHMTPEDFTRHMEVLKKSGARIIGGCCGTTPEFIAQLSGQIN